MSDRFRLISRLYARPTPAGAYHAVAAAHPDPRRRILLGLLGEPTSPQLDIGLLRRWVGDDTIDDQELLGLLCDAQEQGWVEGLDEPDAAPDGPLSDLLEQLLPPLSANGTVLLVDAHGFVLSGHGFTDEAAEALGALSADLANLHHRHHDAFRVATGLSTSAWAVVDGAGNSQLGFWPLHIGDQRFVLAIAGLPRINHPQLTRLIWALTLRYGAASAQAA
ncbi:MAG: hypothetical protein AB7O92_22240 [Acidimicrobiia bacterium]